MTVVVMVMKMMVRMKLTVKVMMGFGSRHRVSFFPPSLPPQQPAASPCEGLVHRAAL